MQSRHHDASFKTLRRNAMQCPHFQWTLPFRTCRFPPSSISPQQYDVESCSWQPQRPETHRRASLNQDRQLRCREESPCQCSAEDWTYKQYQMNNWASRNECRRCGARKSGKAKVKSRSQLPVPKAEARAPARPLSGSTHPRFRPCSARWTTM